MSENSQMPASIHFYQGQVRDCGAKLQAGEAPSLDAEAHIEAAAEWSQLYRWECDLPNAEPTLPAGENTLSLHRMSRVVGMLNVAPGTDWLFRLDQITAPPGRVTDPHKHSGLGIRCMLEGVLNIDQDVESLRALIPGDEPVIAWGSKTMHAGILRSMVFPAEPMSQTDTFRNRAGQPNRKRGQHKLLVDHLFTAPESVQRPGPRPERRLL